MTITEALAELKTLDKRIASKRDFVTTYLTRMEGLKDPLEKDGGSEKVLEQEFQAIYDLEVRIVDLRHAINTANRETALTIEGTERSIEDWLIWRRDVAPKLERFYKQLRQKLDGARDMARRNGASVISLQSQPNQATDIIVNVSEQELNKKAEKLQNILGQLDGQLSLKNATVMISI
jgi:hypothetical protein